MKKKLLAALLAALLLLSGAPSALAEDAAVRKIADERQFAAFLDACARESYSKDKHFVLLNDLDLSKVACAPAPYFAGELDGGGHTIRGLAFAPTGSRQGLFRQLGEGAAIRNLTVEGSVLPGGTREDIGGLVGLNEGTVENCAFSGEVRGVNNVGGLVGRNRGAVTNCRFVGTVCGEHQVGGLVGRNEGVVQKSETDAAVNAEEVTPSGEKRFDLATLSQDDFTDLVNIGGVAGENAGVLSACTAGGSVGWHYTGYNVGGVVGKNSGYVDGCVNTASVEGRRDVGGVVGQSLPYAAWELSEGKLQELSRAIGGLSYQLAVMTQKFSDATDETIETLSGMRGDSENAMSAVKALLRDSADRTASFLDGVSVDPDTGELILPPGGLGPADTTALTSALGSLFAHVRALSGALDGTVGETAEDIKKLYEMRWGIETSFRELKYSIGLTNFHSKKSDYIIQEIWARLILYNFCEAITTQTVLKQSNRKRKYVYQINYTRTIHICRYFLSIRKEAPPDVESLISRELLPVRPGRSDPRKVKLQSAVSFLYRVA